MKKEWMKGKPASLSAACVSAVAAAATRSKGRVK